jgi:hypothetical protein
MKFEHNESKRPTCGGQRRRRRRHVFFQRIRLLLELR